MGHVRATHLPPRSVGPLRAPHWVLSVRRRPCLAGRWVSTDWFSRFRFHLRLLLWGWLCDSNGWGGAGGVMFAWGGFALLPRWGAGSRPLPTADYLPRYLFFGPGLGNLLGLGCALRLWGWRLGLLGYGTTVLRLILGAVWR